MFNGEVFILLLKIIWNAPQIFLEAQYLIRYCIVSLKWTNWKTKANSYCCCKNDSYRMVQSWQSDRSVLLEAVHLGWPFMCMCVLLTDGQSEERHRSLPALEQAGDSAGGDGRHAETQGHQSQRQQVRPNIISYARTQHPAAYAKTLPDDLYQSFHFHPKWLPFLKSYY